MTDVVQELDFVMRLVVVVRVALAVAETKFNVFVMGADVKVKIVVGIKLGSEP